MNLIGTFHGLFSLFQTCGKAANVMDKMLSALGKMKNKYVKPLTPPPSPPPPPPPPCAGGTCGNGTVILPPCWATGGVCLPPFNIPPLNISLGKKSQTFSTL